MSIRQPHVALVGAGPGDPGLITRRGLDLLREADVVIHDRLIGPELLTEARADAELIDVGKVPGSDRVTQDAINRLIVDRAERGLLVVRLKGGDPFIFGRGWEELVECRRAGVECEVVPGVSSATGVPGASGIPVTLRGVARSFAVVTPRVGLGESEHELDYGALARIDTLCVLMGRADIDAVTGGLIAAGRSPRTSAAVIERGTLAGERRVSGNLDNIAQRLDKSDLKPPIMIVVGEAAGIGAAAWGNGPLAGRRLVVTRPREAGRSLVRRLRALGADVIEAPLIRIAYLPARPPELSPYDWIVFTSRHGVEGFRRAIRDNGLDARALAGCRVAAVGPTTAAALADLAIVPDLIPVTYRARTLIEEMTARGINAASVLFPCGSRARDELAVGLRAAGARVDLLNVYATLAARPPERVVELLRAGFDSVLFHSPSAHESWLELGLPGAQAGLTTCIGPTTASAIRAAGGTVDVVPTEYSDQGLIDALIARFSGRTTAHVA